MATLRELAALVQGEIVGDPDVDINGVAELRQASPGSISFLHDPRYRKYLKDTGASAVVVSRNEDVGGLNAIRVDNPVLSFSEIMDHFSPPVPIPREVHSTARVGPSVKLGTDVAVGAYAVVEDRSILGDNVVIGPHSYVGQGCEIGQGTELKFHVCLYRNCVLGDRVVVHSGTVIGSRGFGYETEEGIHHSLRQMGRVVIGNDVEIGANCAIDRGTLGDTVIGDGSKLDNLVHIAHNVRLGRGCLVTAQVGIAGSTIIGDHVVFAGQSGVVDHVEVGDGARVAAKAAITKSVPGGKTYAGMPARDIREKNRLDALVRRLPELVRKIQELESEVSRLKGNG
ncbi:MAG: UDP-3-O-(3-hydroxymyristoyl)glucosamine N-acyltransferase [Fidelibacterota bacterium]